MFPKRTNSYDAPKELHDEDRPRINDEIKTWKIRLIDESGTNVGVVNVKDALLKSRELGMDLVEISPNTNPPVCKIMDFKKYIFDKKKRAKETHHKAPETKEIQLSPNIAQHDIEVKARKAKEFLEDNSKVVLTFKTKGREAQKIEFIKDVVHRFFSLVNQVSTLEEKGEIFVLHPKST